MDLTNTPTRLELTQTDAEPYRGFTLRTAQIRKVVAYDAQGCWQGEWNTAQEAKRVIDAFIDQWGSPAPRPEPAAPAATNPVPAAVQSELLSILHGQLTAAYDVALRLRDLTRESDPFSILASIDTAYRDLEMAVQVINEIRP